MNQSNEVTFFMGKRVDSMTREELIDVVNRLGHLYQVALKDHKRTLDMWSTCAKQRK